jgi:hypothetical protein
MTRCALSVFPRRLFARSIVLWARMQRAADRPQRFGANGGECWDRFLPAARPVGRCDRGRGVALNVRGRKIYGELLFYVQQFFEIAFRYRKIHNNLILRQRSSDDRFGW